MLNKADFLTPKRRRFFAGIAMMLPAMFLLLLIYSVALLFFMRYSFYGFQGGRLIEAFQFDAYIEFFTDSYYWQAMFTSFKLATHVTLLTFLLGYPIAYTINSFRSGSAKKWVTLAIFSPLIVSVVVRTYGWMVLLSNDGLINFVLRALGIISDPLKLVYNYSGVLIASTHVLLPFMVFPILSSLQQLDPSYKEAALDLGARRGKVFIKVTLPLTIQGALAGVQIVFPMMLSSFVTPSLLGGGRVLVMPTLIYRTMIGVNWPIAAVAGLTLLVLAIAFTVFLNRVIKKIFWGKSGGLLS